MGRAYTIVTLRRHASLLWPVYRGLQLARRFPSHTIVHAHPTYQFILALTDKARVHLSGTPFKRVHYNSGIGIQYSHPLLPQSFGLRKRDIKKKVSNSLTFQEHVLGTCQLSHSFEVVRGSTRQRLKGFPADDSL